MLVDAQDEAAVAEPRNTRARRPSARMLHDRRPRRRGRRLDADGHVQLHRGAPGHHPVPRPLLAVPRHRSGRHARLLDRVRLSPLLPRRPGRDLRRAGSGRHPPIWQAPDGPPVPCSHGLRHPGVPGDLQPADGHHRPLFRLVSEGRDEPVVFPQRVVWPRNAVCVSRSEGSHRPKGIGSAGRRRLVGRAIDEGAMREMTSVKGVSVFASSSRPNLARLVPLLLALAVPVAGVACGTRVESKVAAAGPAGMSPSGPTSGAVAADVPRTVPAGAVPTAGSTTAAPPGPVTATQGAPTSRGSATAAGTVSASPKGSGENTNAAATSHGSSGVPASQTYVGGSAGPAPQKPATGSTPLVLASVGTYSGPVGSLVVPMLQGAQMWVSSVNAKGGLNGHPVKVVVYDDGFDPARHRSQVQDAVERRGALAFLQNGETATGEASVAYVTEKRIPVIGVTGGESWDYTSPMYFPQASSGDFQFEAYPPSISRQVVPRGLTKIGTLVCVEAKACTDMENIWAKSAKSVGMEHVYKAKVSITQPDFTAECLAARNAGVQVLFVLMDSNTVNRVGASCGRQNYHPTIAITGQSLSPAMEHDPNLDADGMVSSMAVSPWFTTGTPATDEFRAALAAY